MNLHDTAKFNKFKENILNDPNVFHCSQVITDKYTNMSLGYLSKNVEDYYSNLQNKYYMKIPEIYDFIKKRTIYYLSNPVIKNKNIIDTTIDVLKEDLGFD
jgi:hypothetical protein